MVIFLIVDSTSSGVSIFLFFPFVSCKAEGFWQHDWGSGCGFANQSAVDLQVNLVFGVGLQIGVGCGGSVAVTEFCGLLGFGVCGLLMCVGCWVFVGMVVGFCGGVCWLL